MIAANEHGLSRARLTVLVPAYNAEAHVAAAVESVLAQSFGDFVLLCLDDGSSDHTPEILAGFSDPRVRVVRNAENLGLIGTLNRGLALVETELVARFDADDLCAPGRFSAQVSYLDAHPEVDVLGTAYEPFDDATGTPERVQRSPTSHEALEWTLLFRSALAHPTVLARSDALRRAGGYDADFVHAEDYELWLRGVRAGLRLANLADPWLRLRRHPGSVSQRHTARQQHNSYRAVAIHLRTLFGIELDEHLWHCLVTPRVCRSFDEAWRAAQLLEQLEHGMADRGAATPAVRDDCTRRFARLALAGARYAPTRRELFARWRMRQPTGKVGFVAHVLYRELKRKLGCPLAPEEPA